MSEMLSVAEVAIEVIKKDIKNVHLTVRPPDGRVRITAPKRMKIDTIRLFALSKLTWIRKQQKSIREQVRETEREYQDRENPSVWGKRYLLKIVERDEPPTVVLGEQELFLYVRPRTDEVRCHELLSAWYRSQIRVAVAPLITKWQSVLGVKVEGLFVRQMKTKWGTCNTRRRTIRLSTELAKKPIDCLEHVIVHEMVHLLEPSHNARFVSLMTHHLPDWKDRRDALNRLPVRH